MRNRPDYQCPRCPTNKDKEWRNIEGKVNTSRVVIALPSYLMLLLLITSKHGKNNTSENTRQVGTNGCSVKVKQGESAWAKRRSSQTPSRRTCLDVVGIFSPRATCTSPEHVLSSTSVRCHIAEIHGRSVAAIVNRKVLLDRRPDVFSWGPRTALRALIAYHEHENPSASSAW